MSKRVPRVSGNKQGDMIIVIFYIYIYVFLFVFVLFSDEIKFVDETTTKRMVLFLFRDEVCPVK